MGDAYTGSGTREFDREEREERANKFERIENAILKSPDADKYNELEKRSVKLWNGTEQKRKEHEKEIDRMMKEYWKIMDEQEKMREKYKKKLKL